MKFLFHFGGFFLSVYDFLGLRDRVTWCWENLASNQLLLMHENMSPGREKKNVLKLHEIIFFRLTVGFQEQLLLNQGSIFW